VAVNSSPPVPGSSSSLGSAALAVGSCRMAGRTRVGSWRDCRVFQASSNGCASIQLRYAGVRTPITHRSPALWQTLVARA
jgi:hypothetical protein